ncbi:basic proline-rich protein-like [Cavia porcellus]|uniref:basic proline-rich protein-like n=1 Tax=Cavia porcellus TaxID=10141 RepID=UPI002FE34ECA
MKAAWKSGRRDPQMGTGACARRVNGPAAPALTSAAGLRMHTRGGRCAPGLRGSRTGQEGPYSHTVPSAPLPNAATRSAWNPQPALLDPHGPAPASRFPSNQKARPSETPPLTDSPLANERPRPAPSARSPRGARSEREKRTQPVGAAAPDPPAPRPPPPPPGRVYCPNPKVQFCGPAAASERAR